MIRFSFYTRDEAYQTYLGLNKIYQKGLIKSPSMLTILPAPRFQTQLMFS
jgi:hypothetical protein